MSWHVFESGKTIGEFGSESGTIIRDEEYGDDARITLEKGGSIAPFAITCGVYGWMVHTRFFSTDFDAQKEFEKMKGEIAGIVDAIPQATDPDEEAKSQIVEEGIERFMELFP